jgi:hypothetical protein
MSVIKEEAGRLTLSSPETGNSTPSASKGSSLWDLWDKKIVHQVICTVVMKKCFI